MSLQLMAMSLQQSSWLFELYSFLSGRSVALCLTSNNCRILRVVRKFYLPLADETSFIFLKFVFSRYSHPKEPKYTIRKCILTDNILYILQAIKCFRLCIGYSYYVAFTKAYVDSESKLILLHCTNMLVVVYQGLTLSYQRTPCGILTSRVGKLELMF